VRLIAATNRNLAQRIKQGEFREDLYYRLNVFPIHIPPLRDRVDDVGPLIEHFLEQIAPTLGRPLPAVDPDAMSCLMRYAWPGNVRELRNIVERAVLLADDCIAVQHLPPEIASSTGTAAGAAPLTAGDTDVAPSDLSCTDVSGDASGAVGGGSTLAEHERALIIQALDASDWNQSKAARHLGVSRDNVRYRMKKYGITRR
jgi:transcriptional regulator with GAF, ATPase, and Fis domain